jgi:hypothetical protein
MRIHAPVVGPNYFLSFTTPDVIRGVEILIGARRQPIEHEKFLRTQRTAKG